MPAEAPQRTAPSPLATSPILDVIDRMIAAPAPVRPANEPSVARTPSAAVSTPVSTTPILSLKSIQVDRSGGVKDSLDETAELFKTIFKGEIVP